ncbi:S-adenosyl-L-methionine-dependent methyltransferase [Nemania diffusa]|nr:S-adenosyl-L-methionine-dependent methyltransferase [Nemania diffusa]
MSTQQCTNHPTEEDDVNDAELSPLEKGLRDLQHARDEGQHIPIIDLTQSDEDNGDVRQYELQIISELDRARSDASVFRGPFRNLSIPLRSRLSSFRYINILIKPRILVEVPQRPREEFSWQFIHVCDIYTDARSNNVIIRGIRLTRHRYMRGLLPRMKNEICALYDIDREDTRHEDIQAAVEVPVTEVIRSRAFSRTNDAFPAHRFNRGQWTTVEDIENKGTLVQRWKCYRHWPSPMAMATKKSYSGAVVRLRYADIEDAHFRVADDKLRNGFRGGITPGGSFINGQIHKPTVDIEKDDQNTTTPLQYRQRYTADDMFCGAGGVSCGTRRAGLQPRLACDIDPAAAISYRENFPEAILKETNIFKLAEESRTLAGLLLYYSDFLHISPPCQVWSPVHTRPGKDDEANVAALFACAEVLNMRRPRISTGEQTFGLLFDRNENFFNALVGQYTALGYSFSWDILSFKEYGVPSIRRRLIWIASCPGEALPPFPTPTHAERNRDLPNPVTLHDVLNNIGRRGRDHLHDVEGMLSRARNSTKFPREPYDDRIQIGTVTTAGSEWAHPSGKRNFTLRELAVIQGFPRSHKFVGTMTQINRQIGNAFPPVVVETLYRHLKKWLLRQDGIVDRCRETLQTSNITATERRRRDIIILDPVEDVVDAPQPSRVITPIVIDDDIAADDSGDVAMIDLTDTADDCPSFSRESSCTLLAESLPSVMEVEVDNERNAEIARLVRRHLERQREEARAHSHAQRHWN